MFMEKKRTQILLQKYYDGITSLQEELDLIEHFSENEAPEEWKWAKEQLLGLRDISNEDIPIPDDLQQSILQHLEPMQKEHKVKRLNTRPIYSVVSVAASIVLIASALIFLNRQPDLGNINDTELAFSETKQALDLVSKYFNQGTEQLSNLNIFEEAVKPLNNLKRVDDTRKTMEYLKNFDRGVETVRGILNTNEQ